MKALLNLVWRNADLSDVSLALVTIGFMAVTVLGLAVHS